MQPPRMGLKRYLGDFTPLRCSFRYHIAIKHTVFHFRLQKRGWEATSSLACWDTVELRQKINGVRKRKYARRSLTFQPREEGATRLFSQLMGNLRFS